MLSISFGITTPQTKLANILYNHLCKFPYQIVYPENFTHQSGRSRPSTLDFFITDYRADFACETTENFDTPHRPVILTAKHSNGPTGIDTTTDWENFQTYQPTTKSVVTWNPPLELTTQSKTSPPFCMRTLPARH